MSGLASLVTHRPLAFFDLETTGTSTKDDRIVEISVVLHHPGGGRVSKTRRLNPGIPIPEEATEVHGITDVDVAEEPTFGQIKHSLLELLDPCDLAGFNIRRFDLPLLQEEFQRNGLCFDHKRVAAERDDPEAPPRRIIDLMSIFHLDQPRDLAAAARRYAGRELQGAHSAEADTEVLPDILTGQLANIPALEGGIDAVHRFCDELQPYRSEIERWFGDDLENPVFQFGKVQGRSLDKIILEDIGYINWMLGKADIGEATRAYLRARRRQVFGSID